MEWMPIETYDKLPMKRRPKLAIFYFKEEVPPRISGMGLDATVQPTRRYGSRVCTHWMPLEPPQS